MIDNKSSQVYFGNLNIKEFEKAVRINFFKNDAYWLEKHLTESANNIDPDKFHIFQSPLGIVCGHEIFDELIKILKNYDFSVGFYVIEEDK